MKIVSWDVGIKHLAYCILDDTNNCKIIKWDIINTVDPENLCCYFKDCDKKVNYKLNILGKTYYLCTFHKTTNNLIQNEINKIKENNTEYCEQIIKSTGIKCSKKCCNKYINNYYCKTHINNIKKRILNTKPETSKINCNKVPIEDIKFNLIKKLELIPELLDVKKVLIENQPAMKNPKMKAIADTLYTWYLIRGKIDNKNIDKISYISPSNKLKIDEDNTIRLLSTTKNDTEKYKLTKQLSVSYTQQLLKDDILNLNFINSKKKKDDLADSYLQGLYYINILSKNNS